MSTDRHFFLLVDLQSTDRHGSPAHSLIWALLVPLNSQPGPIENPARLTHFAFCVTATNSYYQSGNETWT